ncbi:MAG: AI-2E family transporter [Candidatus Obscuribacterales bacterium]|nr:AI-2E family transporter [Steroidobacteraceae bacterium]
MSDQPGSSDPNSPRDLSESAKFNQAPSNRSWALVGLFILALLAALHFARDVVLPIFVALLLHWMFAPVVRAMNKLRIPTPLGATIIVLGLLSVFVGGIYNLAEPARDWIEKTPRVLREIGTDLKIIAAPVKEVTAATDKVQALAESIAGGDAGRKVQEVVIKERSLASVVAGAIKTFSLSTISALILLYFLLASGDLFLRKIIAATPLFADKKRAVDISRQVESDISTYLFTVTAINVSLGCAVALAMYLIGVPNPMLWGVTVGSLNFIPYLGDVASFTILTTVGLLTFDEVWRSLLVPGVFYALTAFEGYFITPLILGNRLSLNPVVIVLSLLLWGWLWGIPGAVLAVPILVVLKTVSERVDSLKTYGEFLHK